MAKTRDHHDDPDQRVLKDIAYDRLEQLIIRDELPAGCILSEANLSEKLGIGRTPVREALQRLSREGLVTILPRRGLIVAELNVAQQLQVLEVRRPLARLTASCAARRATVTQRTKMIQYASEILMHAQNAEGEALFQMTRESHMLLEDSTHNDLIRMTLAPLHARSRRFWFAHYERHGDLKRAGKCHSDVLCAVASGREADAENAADALIDYLDEFARETIAYYGRTTIQKLQAPKAS